jgi:protein SPT2
VSSPAFISPPDPFNLLLSRYRDEDFDESMMESDYRTVMREEFISKKLGMLEDLEDMRMEQEELARKKAKKARRL